ncbi:MAG: DUF4143 domain-containing protein [Candidatus Muiribacteriota bacterium]
MTFCNLSVFRVNKPNIPLKSYQDNNSFKTYLLDTGLLSAMVDLDEKSILEGNKIFTEFKGSLTEQFILQEIKSNIQTKIYYWASSKGTAEIDFIIQNKNLIIPIEVKAEENLQSKSLKSFKEKFNPEICIRTSMSDYREENWLINIPLYCISNISLSLEKK